MEVKHDAVGTIMGTSIALDRATMVKLFSKVLKQRGMMIIFFVTPV